MRGKSGLSLALRFVLVLYSPFSTAIILHGDERAGLCALYVRLFDLRMLVCVSLVFFLVSMIGCGLSL